MAQTAPLVLAPHDSALFAMKRDAIPAPTPRHGCPRAATSSCETFISLITASGRPAGHRRAWARRVGARQPDLRYYRCCPRSASTSSGLSNEPNNSTFCPETCSGQPFFVATHYVALHSFRLEHCVLSRSISDCLPHVLREGAAGAQNSPPARCAPPETDSIARLSAVLTWTNAGPCRAPTRA